MDASLGMDQATQVEEGDKSLVAAGIVFIVFMFIGLVTNSVVIHAFRKTKHLQTPLNVLIIGCTIIDITMLLVGMPFLIASSFYGYWIFGSAWCEGYGFVMTLLGVSSICILTAIAVDRYLVVTQRPFARKITTFKAVMTIFSCLGYGLLWATFPLVGWGSYVVEPCQIACGPDWSNPALSPRSYNIVITTLVFGVPVSIIIFCYVQIVIKVKKNQVSPEELLSRTRLREIHVACSVFLAILSFLIAWSPYTFMSIWSMYNGVSDLPKTLVLLVPLLAKSASAWNPLIYALRSNDFRRAIAKLVFRKCHRSQRPSNETDNTTFLSYVGSMTPGRKVSSPKHRGNGKKPMSNSSFKAEKKADKPKTKTEFGDSINRRY